MPKISPNRVPDSPLLGLDGKPVMEWLLFFNNLNKRLVRPQDDYANDVAAAAGGVPVGGYYHTSGTLKIRIS